MRHFNSIINNLKHLFKFNTHIFMKYEKHSEKLNDAIHYIKLRNILFLS